MSRSDEPGWQYPAIATIFGVWDDMGVWPDKDFTKWVNCANEYSQMFESQPLHSDPTDDL
jgi:hypothetical protein